MYCWMIYTGHMALLIHYLTYRRCRRIWLGVHSSGKTPLPSVFIRLWLEAPLLVRQSANWASLGIHTNDTLSDSTISLMALISILNLFSCTECVEFTDWWRLLLSVTANTGITPPIINCTIFLKYSVSSIPSDRAIVSAARVLLATRFNFPLCHAMAEHRFWESTRNTLCPPQLSTPFRFRAFFKEFSLGDKEPKLAEDQCNMCRRYETKIGLQSIDFST